MPPKSPPASLVVDTGQLAEIGDNVKAIMIGTRLVVVIDLEMSLGPSSSGKMTMVATTHGFVPCANGTMSMNMNIGRRNR